MLNRLYIVLGSLLILLISFAFIAPYFIDWSDRRPQIETLATEALGTPVTVSGRIDIHFLPQPRITIDGISVGPETSPVARIAHAEADFSLSDFLRDRYTITKLIISGADIRLSIGANGHVTVPVNLPETVNATNVSVARADLTQSTVTLADARNGGTWQFADIEGNLTMSALRGPFGFNATGQFQGAPYQVRINTSQMNADGGLQLALFLKAIDAGFVLSADGLFQSGVDPGFSGKLTFRQPPPADNGSVRGNLVLDAKIDANTERVRLTSYVIVPDENRAGTRLTGAASINLGETPSFGAVVSGGVVSLAPRDARKTSENDPYELVRLLSELPTPPVPPITGSINVDISELDIRAFSLREVRLDAATDGKSWQVETFKGKLPGDASLVLSGTLGDRDGKPSFSGHVGLETDRLDALVQLWRSLDERTPLYGISASLGADLGLKDASVTLSNGTGRIDGAEFTFSGTVPSPGGQLDIAAHLGAFDAAQSATLFAVLPEIGDDPRFASSFAGGSFDMDAETLDLFGLAGSKLSARGSWAGKGINFDHMAAGDWGGASFTLSGGWKPGTKPELTANGRLILDADADAETKILPFLYQHLGVAPELQPGIARLLPASLDIDLTAPDDAGVQKLDISGRAGDSALVVAANLEQGLTSYLHAKMGIRATLTSDSPAALAAELGIDADLDTTGKASATLIATGSPANSMDVQLTFASPTDKLQYTGSVIPSDLGAIKGRGKLEFTLEKPADWAGVVGVSDLYLPKISGVSEISFTGLQSVTLSALNADAGGTSVHGELVRALEAGTPLYSGSLTLGGVDVSGFASLFVGGAALLDLEGGVWPDGPFAEAAAPRSTRGRISVAANAITSDGQALAGETNFTVYWDDRNTRLRGLSARMGGGTLSLDLGLCCAGTLGPRHVTGRLGLDAVSLDALLPEAPAETLDATITSSLQFDGTGETLAAIIASLSGQGSFSARDIAIAGFDPGAFETIAQSDTLLGLDAGQLADLVAKALSSGPFRADQMDGVLSLAGGTLRADNLAASSGKGELYGSAAFNLSDLGVSGGWTLSPSGTVGDGALINESTARISAVLGGTIFAPEHELDLAQMVDSIQVRAYEIEVERLEKLKAEDEARAHAAAEERARLMAIEARRKAEQAAAQAEAEAKARADAEAKAKAAADAQAKAAADAKARAEAEAAAAAATPDKTPVQPPETGGQQQPTGMVIQQEGQKNIEDLLKDLGESQDPMLPSPTLDDSAPLDLLGQ